jgi:nicotinamide-nucleotide amidase
MKTEILTVGDEILIGQIVDINSAWIAKELGIWNIKPTRMISLSDNREEMLEIFKESFERADLIIITGGLGPTKDDLTKDILAEFFNSGWRWDQETLDTLDGFFKERNRELSESNKKQAYLPDNCETIPNKWGTAPGMLFRKNGKILASFPGVPFEMQKMFRKYLIPEIVQNFKVPEIKTHHFFTVNIPESVLSDKIEDIEDNLPPNFSLAYLPNLNVVRLRLSYYKKASTDEITFNKVIEKIRERIKENIVVEKDILFEDYIFQLLASRNQTLSVAESCTGGLVSSKLTQLAGISSVFMGGVVSYSNESKTELLRVPKENFKKHGAVSKEVVGNMLDGCKERFHTDYSIAISGITGPGGGSPNKPVGTVYIGIIGPNGKIIEKHFFPGDRVRVMERTFFMAMEMLRREILRG